MGYTDEFLQKLDKLNDLHGKEWDKFIINNEWDSYDSASNDMRAESVRLAELQGDRVANLKKRYGLM